MPFLVYLAGEKGYIPTKFALYTEINEQYLFKTKPSQDHSLVLYAVL